MRWWWKGFKVYFARSTRSARSNFAVIIMITLTTLLLVHWLLVIVY